MSEETHRRGTVVLVPFPFTDLTGRKRRPALVVSPEGFDREDLILCAITSQVPESLPEWETSLEAGDMVEERLPKRSVVKVGKLFTMHRNLIAGRFGMIKEQKLLEVLVKLQMLFSRSATKTGGGSEGQQAEGDLRRREVDEAVLALLHLNAFEDHGLVRSWKTFDWDAMDRLHERGLISEPKSKAKSVVLTEEGRRAAEQAFRRKFAP